MTMQTSTESLPLALPDIHALMERMVEPIVLKTSNYQITSDADFDAAGVILEQIKAITRAISEEFDPVVDSWFKGHRTATATRKSLLDPLALAERRVKEAWGIYRRKKEAEAGIERLRLEAEARKNAEDQKLETAVAFEKAGQKDEASAILNDPTPAIIVIPKNDPPKLDKMSLSQKWYAEVPDFASLVRAVAAGQVPITMLEPNQKALDSFAQSTKGQMQIPGVKFYAKDVVRNLH